MLLTAFKFDKTMISLSWQDGEELLLQFNPLPLSGNLIENRASFLG